MEYKQEEKNKAESQGNSDMRSILQELKADMSELKQLKVDLAEMKTQLSKLKPTLPSSESSYSQDVHSGENKKQMS